LVHTRGKRSAYRILVTKSEEKRPIGKLAHREEDNIQAYFEEIGLLGGGSGSVKG
jgi:hypothetical protein